MIVVRLMGGLGNQMFQYAAARRLSCLHGSELRLDLSFLENSPLGVTKRSLELHNLSVQARPASHLDLITFGECAANTPSCIFSRMLAIMLGKVKRSTYIEPHFHFALDALSLPDDTRLVGYWQSPRYFADIAGLIRKEFQPKKTLTGKNFELSNLIKSCNSVSLHIRRGDYVTSQSAVQFHGICDIDYYHRCVAMIMKKVASPHFFIFSDDHTWVRGNLSIPHPVTVVDHNDPERGCDDLRLMCLCKHNIIANSSFSWWGAWLNDNPDKIVLAPKRWFVDPAIDISDLIPSSWLML